MYHVQGMMKYGQVDIVKSVKTRTGNIPFDITVTRYGKFCLY